MQKLLVLLMLVALVAGACTDGVSLDSQSDNGDTTEETPSPTSTPNNFFEDPTAVAEETPVAPVTNGPSFSYEALQGDQWQGNVHGVVALELYPDVDADKGVCFAILGTLTPTSLSTHIISQDTVPDIGLLVDGEFNLGNGNINCDVDQLEDLGYQGPRDISVTANTSADFYTAIFLDAPDAAPSAVLVGDARNGDAASAQSFDLQLLDAVPQITEYTGDLNVELSALSDAQYTYTEPEGDTWNVQLFGLTTTPQEFSPDQPGTCYVLLGVLTPLAIDSGAVSNPSSAPEVTLVADGQQFRRDTDCQMLPFQELGYGTVFDAEVTLNTAYSFAKGVFVPEGAELQAVLAGNRNTGDQFAFTPTVLDEIPEPESGGGVNVTDGQDLASMLGTTFTSTARGDVWETELLGLVEVPVLPRGPGRCFALVGVHTVVSVDTGLTSWRLPEFEMVAGGRALTDATRDCDDLPAIRENYRENDHDGLVAGTQYPFFVHFLVEEGSELEAIVVGRASDEDAVFVAPQVLDSMPAHTATGVGEITQPLDSMTGATFLELDRDDNEWQFELFGLVASDPDERVFGGTCYALIGTVTSTELVDATETKIPSNEFSAIIDGRVESGGNGGACPSTAEQEAGYQFVVEPDLIEGNTYKFLASFYVADGETLQAIVHGEPSEPADEGSLFFEPIIITEIP